MKKWFQKRLREVDAPIPEDAVRKGDAMGTDAPSLQALGNQSRAKGQLTEARALYQRAVDLDPGYWPAWLGRGLVDLDEAQLGSAQEAFERVDKLRPGGVDAPYFLGLVALDLGQAAIAIGHFSRALLADPGFKPALQSLAPLGRSDDELSRFESLARKACQTHPEDLDIRTLFAIALRTVRLRDEALAQFDHILQFRPAQLEALINRAELLGEMGRQDDAHAAAEALLQSGAMRLDARIALGWVFLNLGMTERAREEYLAAESIGPISADLCHLLAKIEWTQGHLRNARDAWQRGVALDPTHVASRMGLADCFFFENDYARGWSSYEARLDLARIDLTAAGQRIRQLHNTNRWYGEAKCEGTLYIWAEQGFGDQIMMAPWIAKAQERFEGSIVLCNPPPLQRLLAQLVPLDAQIASRDQIPEGALNCPELSLPLALGELGTPLPRGAYLSVEDEWKTRFASRASSLKGLKVGLVWAGASRYTEDRQRSTELRVLAPLAAIEGISWVSLQKGSDARLLSQFPAVIADWTDDILDFADTAGLMSCLDLVIAVDTAPAHLAGALGIPVWLLSRYPGEWRWGHAADGANNWYRSMRVFTQPSRGDWATVVERLRLELSAWRDQRLAAPIGNQLNLSADGKMA